MCKARGKWVSVAVFFLTLQLSLRVNLASVSPRKRERLGRADNLFSVLSAKNAMERLGWGDWVNLEKCCLFSLWGLSIKTGKGPVDIFLHPCHLTDRATEGQSQYRMIAQSRAHSLEPYVLHVMWGCFGWGRICDLIRRWPQISFWLQKQGWVRQAGSRSWQWERWWVNWAKMPAIKNRANFPLLCHLNFCRHFQAVFGRQRKQYLTALVSSLTSGQGRENWTCEVRSQ